VVTIFWDARGIIHIIPITFRRSKRSITTQHYYTALLDISKKQEKTFPFGEEENALPSR